MTPAVRREITPERQLRADELFRLADLLETYEITPDAGPLRDAGGRCLGNIRQAHEDAPDAGRSFWGYQIENLRLRLEPQRHCRPRAADAERLEGTLSVDVEEYVPDQVPIGASYERIRRLDASFSCNAEMPLDGAVHRLRTAWHVDTHLHVGQASDAMHPRFHFQTGGREFADLDASIRGVLLLEAPRLACPPLDGILAVDFILAHYRGVHWEELRAMDPRYGRLRKPAMERYWAPYFRLLADAVGIAEGVPSNSAAALLLPNLSIQ